MKDKQQKRLPIYFSDEALGILSVIQDQHGDIELTLSGAVNLAVQMAGIIARTPIRLSSGELLYCCDICNGGAHLTEFKAPTDVSIRQALESMKLSLFDGVEEPGILEKWDIKAQPMITRIQLMDEGELFALAMATRQFWSGKPFANIKPPGKCASYQEWAAQWVDNDINPD